MHCESFFLRSDDDLCICPTQGLTSCLDLSPPLIGSLDQCEESRPAVEEILRSVT